MNHARTPASLRAEAEAAFDAGAYARVRELAAALGDPKGERNGDASDDDVRALHDLAARTRPDLVQIAVLVVATLLVAWVAWEYVLR